MGQYFTKIINPSTNYSIVTAAPKAMLTAAAVIISYLIISPYFTTKTSVEDDDENTTSTLKTGTPTTLLQPAMKGDLDTIKDLIHKHILATATVSEEVDKSLDKFKDKQNERKIQSFVNLTDLQNNTPLHGAVFSGHFAIVQYLIEECKATFYTSSSSLSLKNALGCTPVWIAAGYDQYDILQYLIQTVQAKEEENKQKYLIDMLCDSNKKGDSPLLASVSKNYLKICQLILQSVKDVSSSSSGDATTSTTTDKKDRSVYDLLCQANKSGDTPLSVCVSCGYDGELFKLLLDWEEREYVQEEELQKRRPLNTKNSNGLTPLLVACERNFATIVQELIYRGGIQLLTICDNNGRSPLAIGVFCGCVDVVKMIFSILLKDDETDTSSNTTKKMKETILNQKDNNGCTPLWLASRTGNVTMVEMLIREEQKKEEMNNTVLNSINVRDDYDKLTPEEVAVKYKKDKVVDWFCRYREEGGGAGGN